MVDRSGLSRTDRRLDFLSIRLHAARDRPYLRVTLCRLGRLSRDGSTMVRTSASSPSGSLFHAPCTMSDVRCTMRHVAGPDPAPRTHSLAPSDATANACMLTYMLSLSLLDLRNTHARAASWVHEGALSSSDLGVLSPRRPNVAPSTSLVWVNRSFLVVPEPERAQVSPREGDVHERERRRARVELQRHRSRDAYCSVCWG